MAKPTNIGIWAGGVDVQPWQLSPPPSPDKILQGWTTTDNTATTAGEKPTLQFWNVLLNNITQWTSYIDEVIPADFTSLGTMAEQDAGAVAITGGSVTGTILTTSSLTATGGDITGVQIDDSPIGDTTPSTGAFTTLSATGAATLASGTVAATPSVATSIVNKQYADAVVVESASDLAGFMNKKITLPGGVIFQIFYMNLIGGSSTSIVYDFPWEFPNECFGMNSNDCGTGASSGISVITTSVVRVDNATFYAWGKNDSGGYNDADMCITAWGI